MASDGTSGVCFVDVETTGLDPDLHQIWEVGLIVDDEEYLWHLPVDLGRADPVALRIGGFHERWLKTVTRVPLDGRGVVWGDAATPLDRFAYSFARLTRDRHLVGAVVSFDEERLRRLLRANGACPEWHHHLIDVEALAVGFLYGIRGYLATPEGICGRLPWRSEDLSMAVGVDPNEFDRHTALGDARWAKAIYERVTRP